MQFDYREVLQHLRRGGVILYPTDTIWGVGCDASNAAAVQRVFDLKQRDAAKALVVLIADVGQLTQYVVQVPDVAWEWVDFAEKPLTVIYPKGKNVAPNVLAPDGSLAIRLVKDEFCKNLVYRYGRALVSTSANVSGQPAPDRFEAISEEIKRGVDYILQPPVALQPALPSTIVRLGLGGEVEFLRK
ncbi:MAG: threonylcarbamoyl-AMP synthase [Cytophagaceae bacterium]|nr:threonylcarbamoyl-AMP synthase [Cytophagaceae bacterium]